MRYTSRYMVVLYCILISLLTPFNMGLAAPANGVFVATQACDAYASKNKRTNPDHFKITVGGRYDVFETSTRGDSIWFRLRATDARPSERWVEKACGTAELGVVAKVKQPTVSSQCDIADKGDSYVLAVSWQPAFCVSHQDKPECTVRDAAAYQASNFTLHGLWPNQLALCGTRYGYCGAVKTQPGRFCDYPPVGISQPVRDDLGVVMPSVAAGSCLERHEWFKHGTCQSQLDSDGYFETAVGLTKQFNDSGLAAFMAANVGKSVDEAGFIAAVDTHLGAQAHERLHLTCRDGSLVDVYIDLPGSLSAMQKLGELIAQAKPTGNGYSSNCKGKFNVQALGGV
ncbi:MAG: ribonuclease T [Sulfuricellaceae bacterium]